MTDMARYYLARVHRSGNVTPESIADAIVDPVQVEIGSYVYTFTNIERAPDGRFVFAYLAKYQATGEVAVVEPDRHVDVPAEVPNLQVARSAFVYIPAHAAVAFQHVWNKLQRDQFAKAFTALVLEKHQHFFAGCELEAITDLTTFIRKIGGLDVVTGLEATVHPPNPLFGTLWGSLRDHMKQRNVDEVQVREKAASPDGITTAIPKLARATTESDTPALPPNLPPPSLPDAAVLMAADGYGKAKVKGTRRGQRTVVRTQESQLSFELQKDPIPETLYDAARQVLVRIERERGLEHE